MEILRSINAVQAELAKEGISKGRKNQAQGYSFRGIDDMYNVMSPLLAANNIVVLPAYSDRNVTERETQKGGVLFYTTLKGDFTFRSSKDGSEVRVTTYGEAMDSGDKATNKAMSAALKYAFMQTFTIPTEGDNDSETQTHEVAAKRNGNGQHKSPTTETMQDHLSALPIEDRESLRRLAGDLEAMIEEGRSEEAWNLVEGTLSDVKANDEKNDTDKELYMRMGLWSLLGSKARSAIKKVSATKRAN